MSAKNWFTIRNTAAAVEISIHDEIGAWGVSAKQFLSDLRAAPANLPIHLSLHSPGGEVLDGLAIYNSLKSRALTAPVHVKIEGLAASMASVIAMAGTTISMPRNAYMMVHNPSGFAMGDATDMRELADLLDKLKGSLLNAYESRTGLTRDELTSLMDAETWMDGTEALERGFCDHCTDDVALAALAAFDTRKFHNMPAHATPTASAAAEIAVEPPAPAPEPVTPPVEEPSAPAATETDPPVVEPAAPVEPPAPAARGFFERVAAAFSGDNALKAELESVRAGITARDTEIAALKSELEALKPKAAQFDEIEAKLKAAEAAKETVGRQAAAIAAAHGLRPDQQSSLPAPAAASPADTLAQFEAITDPGERQAFFAQHKEEINTAYIASKKQ